MTINIGYYANFQGSGHLVRARCFEKQLDIMNVDYKLWVFTAKKCEFGPKTTVVPLPKPIYSNVSRGCYEDYWLNISDVLKPIMKVCLSNKLDIFISDVSVEVANAVRPFVKKLVYILLHGERNDYPHKNVFQLADTIIAPYHEDLADYYTDSVIGVKYSGGFTKSQYLPKTNVVLGDFEVLVILGQGGNNFVEDYIKDTPNVLVLGLTNKVYNPEPYIKHAKVVVGNVGNSLVHEVSQMNKPFIGIAEPRHYYEQDIKANILQYQGYAMKSGWWSNLNRDLEALKPQKNKTHLVEKTGALKFTNLILE